MTRILVTGGAGAIGGNLVGRLVEEGHDVLVLDDLSSGRLDLVPHGAVLVQGSVERGEDLAKAFEHRPEEVLHMAARFANQNSVDSPERDLAVNGMGTLRVFKEAQRHGVRKVLYVSSSCVYGGKPLMHEDDEVFQPDTPYAITKLLGERYARFFAGHHGLDIVTVRPFNSYGPGEMPGRYRNVIPNFFRLAMRGEPLPITGTGEETRDFTFVGDVVSAMLGALRGPTRPGDVFNIATGRSTRILEIAERVNTLAGNGAGIEFRPRRAWDHVPHRIGDASKAKSVFGFTPTIDLGEGLRRTYSWLDARRAEVVR